MTQPTRYPWQETIWQQIRHNSARMHHALLLHGQIGIGKDAFARYLSQSLLCLQPNAQGEACGQCASCHWFADESHPDFRLLTPEQESESEDEALSSKKTKKKTQISVAQIRELSDFVSLSSHRSNGLRIVLIYPAEALNLASANALLKMLEEPASGVMFILVTHQLQRLLPTIISRCQKISMPAPSEAQAIAWLETQGIHEAKQQLAYLAGSPMLVRDAPLAFQSLAEAWRLLALGQQLQPHLAAPALLANSAETGITVLQKWLYDLLAVKLGTQVRYHLQHISALQALAGKVNLSKLFEMQKKTNELRKLALHPLNHELQLESVLVDYTKMFQS